MTSYKDERTITADMTIASTIVGISAGRKALSPHRTRLEEADGKVHTRRISLSQVIEYLWIS
jgi:hypothetical protein